MPGRFRPFGSALRLAACAARGWLGSRWSCRAGEVHVTNDDAVLELNARCRACHAQAHVPKRRRRHGARCVFHLSGCCVILNLPAAIARAFKKATVEAIAPEADETTRVKVVSFPASFVNSLYISGFKIEGSCAFKS